MFVQVTIQVDKRRAPDVRNIFAQRHISWNLTRRILSSTSRERSVQEQYRYYTIRKQTKHSLHVYAKLLRYHEFEVCTMHRLSEGNSDSDSR